MHYPPAPEIADGERLFNAGKRDHPEGVKDSDVDRRRPDQMLEADAAGPELARRSPPAARARPHRPHDEKAPKRKTDEEADLPEAAELDIGKSLVPEPEPVLVDHTHDAEIIARERADHDQHGHPKQKIDRPMLSLRLFAAGDGRRKEKRRADPGYADPHDRRLDMHVAQEVEREPIVDRDAV